MNSKRGSQFTKPSRLLLLLLVLLCVVVIIKLLVTSRSDDQVVHMDLGNGEDRVSLHNVVINCFYPDWNGCTEG